MKLTVLGCGDAFGNGGRYNTSFLLSDRNQHVLVDCGASTLIRLKQETIDLEDISTIVITHFHADHYGGIPFFLISSLFESARKAPLTIVGPPEVESRVIQLLEGMYSGTADKLKNLDLRFYEFEDTQELNLGDLIISGWRVEHSPPSNPHGVRLEWNQKIFAFSGDTSWTENLIPLSRDADIFICECNFLNKQAFGHLSYEELVEKRPLLKCDNVWLTHLGKDVLELKDPVFERLEDGLKMEF